MAANLKRQAVAYAMHQILGYLKRRPDAADTERGVVEWWLYRQHIEDGPAVARDALKRLVAIGVMAVEPHAGGEPIYRLAAGRDAAALRDDDIDAGEDDPPEASRSGDGAERHSGKKDEGL